MIVLSWNIDDLMGTEKGQEHVNIMFLTVIFFMLNFLAATQDIAVDGWALTMLSRYIHVHVHLCYFYKHTYKILDWNEPCFTPAEPREI
jgi:PAT family acetyl-CoA transporter-like MFS transporter 1